MKSRLLYLSVIAIAVCIWSCSQNGKARDAFFRGIYDLSTQVQEMKHADGPTQQDKETPSYDQYKRERQDIIREDEGHPSPHQGN